MWASGSIHAATTSPPRKKAGSHLKGIFVDPGAGLDFKEKSKISRPATL